MTRIISALCLVLLLVSAALADPFGEVRYADRPLNVRKARSLDSEHVKTLQPGDRVRVDFLKDGWYAVFDVDASEHDESKALGYANGRFLLPVPTGAAKAPAVEKAPAAPPAVEKAPPAVEKAPAAVEKAPVAAEKAPVPAAPAPAPEKVPAPAIPVPAPKAQAEIRVPVEIKSAASDMPLRAARDLTSPVTGKLAAGEKVQAAFLRDGWYAIFPLDAKSVEETRALGYVHASRLLPATPGVKPLAEAPAAPQDAAPAPASSLPAQPEVKEEARVVPPVGAVQEKPSGQAPVKISADRMTYAEKDRKVTFSGNVRAEHEGLQLWAATLSAYFADAGKGGKDVTDNIERIVADGGVRMKKGTSEGSCQTLTYYVKDGVLRMEGNPVLSDGPNKVAGEVIKFYVKDNRSEVSGGQNKRVEAIFQAPEGVKKP